MAGSTPIWEVPGRARRVIGAAVAWIRCERSGSGLPPWMLVEPLPRSGRLCQAGDGWLSRSRQKWSNGCVLVGCRVVHPRSMFPVVRALDAVLPLSTDGGINSVAAESGVSERRLSVEWSESSLRRNVLNVIVVYWSVFFLCIYKERQAFGLSQEYYP